MLFYTSLCEEVVRLKRPNRNLDQINPECKAHRGDLW
jgi:hypothetical protein